MSPLQPENCSPGRRRIERAELPEYVGRELTAPSAIKHRDVPRFDHDTSRLLDQIRSALDKIAWTRYVAILREI